jgi:hypothetical protein
MELLGDRNWWLPGWLDRLLPEVLVEPADPEPPAPVEGLQRTPTLATVGRPAGEGDR